MAQQIHTVRFDLGGQTTTGSHPLILTDCEKFPLLDDVSSVTETIGTGRSNNTHNSRESYNHNHNHNKNEAGGGSDSDVIASGSSGSRREVIYGRTNEVRHLRDAFQRVQGKSNGKSPTTTTYRHPQPKRVGGTNNNSNNNSNNSNLLGTSELVVLHGVSGTGKTMLVEAALRNYCPNNGGGCLITGKFNQFQMPGESFSALSAAFSDLCDVVVSTSMSLTHLQDALSRELGSEANTLAALVPNLHYLLPDLKVEWSNTTMTTTTNNNNSDHHDTTTPSGALVVPRGGQKSFTRLKQLCCSFLTTIAKTARPIALFLDDLQWADPASLSIIQAILTQTEPKHLLVVVAFRDDDEATNGRMRNSPPASSLATANDDTTTRTTATRTMGYLDFFESIQGESTFRKSILEIDGLDLDGISEMVHGFIAPGSTTTRKDVNELSKLVHRKTNGNPYFVTEFLDLLQNEELLYRCGQDDDDDSVWDWSLEQIQAETNVSENVANLVSGKIDALPRDVQCVLTLASYLGYHFNINLLLVLCEGMPFGCKDALGKKGNDDNNNASASSSAAASSSSGSAPPRTEQELSNVLEEAVRAGLIERHGIEEYKFSHDRVQQCLFEGVAVGAERASFHLKVGRVLRNYWVEIQEEIDDQLKFYMLGLATDHLNVGSDTMEQKEAEELVRHNLEVGKWRLRQSAFGSSLECFNKGHELLNKLTDDKWRTHYTLTLQVLSMKAYLEFCNGDYAACDAICQEILVEAESVTDKLDAYITSVQCLGSQKERLRDSVLLGISVLEMLGERLPRKPSFLHIGVELIRARRALYRMSPDDLLGLPMMQDPDKLAAIKIMCAMVFSTFSDENSKPYFAIITLRMMTITCHHGHTSWSPVVFAQYGGLEAVIGNLSGARSFLTMTNTMLEESSSSQAHTRANAVMHGLLSQWYCPYSFALQGSKSAYLAGMMCGEFDWALYNANQFVCLALLSTQGLISLENDLRIFCQQMQEFNLDTTLFLTIPAWQAVTNLIGDAVDDPADLSGDIMDLEEFEASLRNGTNALATQVLLLFRMRLAVMFDRGHLMHELYWPIVRGRDKALKGHFTNLEAVCMEGLASYKLYHLNGTRKYRRQARKATRQLHVWAAGGVVNCGPPSLFLKAESIAASDKRRRRRKDEVVACYEKAIQGAQEMEVRQWEAVYTERLFQVMHRVYEDTTVAVEFLDKAIAAYERWEAFSKVEALEAQKMRLEALGR